MKYLWQHKECDCRRLFSLELFEVKGINQQDNKSTSYHVNSQDEISVVPQKIFGT